MWDKLFEMFKKKNRLAEKMSVDLEVEFERIKRQYANLGTTDTYQILTEYFLAKIEVNRDIIESLNPLSESDRIKEVEIKAENRVMRGLIEDVEAMKTQMETEQIAKTL